jgi:uncharacterized protein YqeY
MKTILAAIFFFGLSSLAFSQSASKQQAIKELLDVTGSAKLGMQVVNNMVSMYQKSYSKADSSFWNEFLKEVNPDEFMSLTIPIYDKYFTEEEIRQIIAFYKTTTGKKIISTMPLVMQEAMTAGEAWGKQVGEKIFKRLKEKGYVNNM